jgi:hypothetical protein
MAVQRGRSERRGESYNVPCVEPLSDARTKLADCSSILLMARLHRWETPESYGPPFLACMEHDVAASSCLI